jgi:hypothetical protein
MEREEEVGNLSVLSKDIFFLIMGKFLNWFDLTRLHSINRYFRICTTKYCYRCYSGKISLDLLSEQLHSKWRHDRMYIESYDRESHRLREKLKFI